MKLEKVTCGYQKKIVVRNVELTVKAGEILSLVGPNGGGKSTLLRSISGSLRLLGGTVYVGKEELKNLKPKELARQLSIVTTERVRPQLMTCYDVVMAGRLPYTDSFGRPQDDDERAAKEAIGCMRLEELKNQPFMDLSDGQKQRTLIARAICQEPEYLVMDEPTSYLDIRYRMELMEVCERLAKKGITIIMSLHEPELALQVSDRLLFVLADGSTECVTPEEAMERELLKTAFELDDTMYEKLLGRLNYTVNEPEGQKKQGAAGYANRECRFFPCHAVHESEFSCLFCYCPLYPYEDCMGDYTLSEEGVKNCRDCGFPHEIGNYSKVIRRLKEKMHEKRDMP